MIIADFDGDGIADLASAEFISPFAQVLFGKGDGTFPQEPVFPAAECSFSIAAADFNGDGRLDLVLGNACTRSAPPIVDNVAVLLNAGSRTFSPPIYINIGGAAGVVDVGDFDRDGKVDVAVAQQTVGTASAQPVRNAAILLGHGDGTFAPVVKYPILNGSLAMVVADINGDGKSDLITFGSALFGNGDGTFGPQTTVTSSRIQAVADLNRDGKTDLIADAVLLGNGDGTFVALPPPGVAFQNRLGVGDFNLDGIADIVEAEADRVSVRLGAGDGTFGAPIAFGVPQDVAQLAVGRINGDAQDDVVLVGTQTLFVMLSTCVFPPTVTSLLPASGPTGGGQPVTIIGNNLSGAIVRIMFQGYPLTSNSANTITFKTPSHSQGVVTFTITTDGGQTSANYEYVVAPTHFQISLPSSATIGSPLAFSVTALNAFEQREVGYFGPLRFSSSDAAAALPANPAMIVGYGNYDVTFKSPGSQTITVTDAGSTSIAGSAMTNVMATAPVPMLSFAAMVLLLLVLGVVGWSARPE